MKKRMAEGLKRAAAWLMTVFMILSQLAMPVAALAQDVTMLPSLNLIYPVGEGTQAVTVQPTLYAQQPVYWATVPAETLQSGVTLEILSTGTEGESYNSTHGYQLMAQDASAVDGMMVATYIEVYLNEAFTGSYPLYISTRGLPEEAPVIEPVRIAIECYDQNDSLIYSGEEWMEASREFGAPSLEG